MLIDYNECEVFGSCDQKCVNSPGSYRCLCGEGYTLEDKGTCRNIDGNNLYFHFICFCSANTKKKNNVCSHLFPLCFFGNIR